MDTKSLIIEKAIALLAKSPSGDISTRAICEAAGVTQPILYRLFGDKDGLMVAVIDKVWGEYLAMKRSAKSSDDPLIDLRHGWDRHTAFALAHPHAYRLLFGASLSRTPEAPMEAMEILRAILERLAVQGRLRVSPDQAAQIIMAANSGIALSLILRSEDYSDLSISTLTRDAIFGALIIDADVSMLDDVASISATTLRAHLKQSDLFTTNEIGLLNEWLQRIQNQHSTISDQQTDNDQ